MSLFGIQWLPFAVAALVLAALALVMFIELYRLLRLALKSRWIKRAEFLVPSNGSSPGLGDPVRLGIELLTRRRLTFREVRLRLYCRETAIRRGPLDETVTHIGHRQEHTWRDVPVARRRETVIDTEFAIPAAAMHTLSGEHHFVEWIAEADIIIRRGMTRHLRQTINVAPMRRRGIV